MDIIQYVFYKKIHLITYIEYHAIMIYNNFINYYNDYYE